MRLPEGTISTREGKLIELEALLDEAETRAFAVATRGEPASLPEAERREIARVVGIGAVKYNDLSKDRQTLVTFTWDKALSLTGQLRPVPAVRLRAHPLDPAQGARPKGPGRARLARSSRRSARS